MPPVRRREEACNFMKLQFREITTESCGRVVVVVVVKKWDILIDPPATTCTCRQRRKKASGARAKQRTEATLAPWKSNRDSALDDEPSDIVKEKFNAWDWLDDEVVLDKGEEKKQSQRSRSSWNYPVISWNYPVISWNYPNGNFMKLQIVKKH